MSLILKWMGYGVGAIGAICLTIVFIGIFFYGDTVFQFYEHILKKLKR
jgi:hypothetical protein